MDVTSLRASKATAAAALVLCTVALWMTTAGAHSDDGIMEVIKTEVVSPTEIDVEVGLVYANDDDLATEANIMVTATGPTGEVVGPINLPVIEDARYGATITVPGAGAWTLAITSENPVASTTAAVEVTPEGPAATSTPTSDTSASTGSGVSVDTTAPEGPDQTVVASAPDVDTNGDEETDEDSDGGSIIGYVVAVLAVAGVTTAVVLLRGRRPPGDDGA